MNMKNSTKKIKYPDIWYGLLHLETTKRDDEMLGDVEGAYVNLIAKAHNQDEFVALIKEYTIELDFKFIELTDVSSLQDRLGLKKNIANNLLKTAVDLKEYGHVRFGTFHTY